MGNSTLEFGNKFGAPGQARSVRDMKWTERVGSKLNMASEFWAFLRVRKKWWLAPILVMLLLLGFLIVFTEGSALAPFIYTLF